MNASTSGYPEDGPTGTGGRTWRRHRDWGIADRPEEGDHGGRMYVAPLDTGVIHVLEGPAAVVCRAALLGLDVDGIRTAAAAELGVKVEDVDADVVVDLLDELVGLGVLLG